MRVSVYPADRGGCGHYRLIYPAEVLAAQGHAVVIDEPKLKARWVDDPKPRVVGMLPVDVDVVVLQRPLRAALVDAIPHLQAQGVAVVVECDDDFTCVPPANPAWEATHPKLHPERNWHHLMRAMRLADLVTVSTPALARRYGLPDRVRVLPNCIPEHYLGLNTRGGPEVVVGWTGTPATHPGDLEVTGGGVAQALADTGAAFRAIGSARTLEVLGVEGAVVPWTTDIRQEYPRLVASLDVGIVPLADNAFNRGKSWIKGLEYSACGVAFVASPLPEYRALAERGMGFIASSSRDWRRLMKELVISPGRRADVAGRARTAARELTYEANAWRWMQAWEDACRMRRGTRAAVGCG